MKYLRHIAFALVLGFAAVPSQPFGVSVAGIGEPAHAYAPCDYYLGQVGSAQASVDYWNLYVSNSPRGGHGLYMLYQAYLWLTEKIMDAMFNHCLG